jgi:hypothetical protein
VCSVSRPEPPPAAGPPATTPGEPVVAVPPGPTADGGYARLDEMAGTECASSAGSTADLRQLEGDGATCCWWCW